MKFVEAVEQVIARGGYITRKSYEFAESPTGYDILFQINPEQQKTFKGYPVVMMPFALAILFLASDSPLWAIVGWQFTEDDAETDDWVVVNF